MQTFSFACSINIFSAPLGIVERARSVLRNGITAEVNRHRPDPNMVLSTRVLPFYDGTRHGRLRIYAQGAQSMAMTRGKSRSAPTPAHYKWLRLQAPNTYRAREVRHMYNAFEPCADWCRREQSCTVELRYADASRSVGNDLFSQHYAFHRCSRLIHLGGQARGTVFHKHRGDPSSTCVTQLTRIILTRTQFNGSPTT